MRLTPNPTRTGLPGLHALGVVLAAAPLMACGGASPLLHPAHTLPSEELTVGAGVSANFVRGEPDEQIETSRANAPVDTAAPGDTDAHVAGAVAHALLAPGLAPWVGARVGVGFESDAGLAYTGRGLRIDGRRAFQNDSIALSIGLGASGVLTRRRSDNVDTSATARNIPGVDTSSVTGWGLDVPIVFGWRSDGELLSLYGGVRGGYGHVFGDIAIVRAPNPEPEIAELDAWHLYGGPLVGLAVGIAPLYGVVELFAPIQYGRGSIERETARDVRPSFTGLTLAPAAGLLARF